jgi:hypothetical protein
MANYLLNEVTLIANGKKHRLVELEFYLTCKSHPDPYTHCDDVQKTTANWYFHKTGKSYRGGCVLFSFILSLVPTKDWISRLVPVMISLEEF